MRRYAEKQRNVGSVCTKKENMNQQFFGGCQMLERYADTNGSC